MKFTAKTRYVLVTVAIVLACMVQLARGYRPVIVVIGGLAFLIAGNMTVYVSGSRERAVRRQQARDYYSGNS